MQLLEDVAHAFVVAQNEITKVSASQLDLGKFWLQRLRLGQALLGRGACRRCRLHVVEPDRASAGKAGPGESKLRIETNRFFIGLDGGANGGFVSFPDEGLTAQIGFVGSRVVGRVLGEDSFFDAAQLRLERNGDVVRDFLLDTKDVVEFAIVTLSP